MRFSPMWVYVEAYRAVSFRRTRQLVASFACSLAAISRIAQFIKIAMKNFFSFAKYNCQHYAVVSLGYTPRAVWDVLKFA